MPASLGYDGGLNGRIRLYSSSVAEVYDILIYEMKGSYWKLEIADVVEPRTDHPLTADWGGTVKCKIVHAKFKIRIAWWLEAINHLWFYQARMNLKRASIAALGGSPMSLPQPD